MTFISQIANPYAPLLRYAASQRPPTRLLIITKLFPDEISEYPSATVFTVNPFSPDGASSLLRYRGVDQLSESLQRELIAKTGALPLAISLFCVLVNEFGRDPKSLLEGTWSEIARLKHWFDELSSSITTEAAKLLNLLSLTEGPFDGVLLESFVENFWACKKDRWLTSINSRKHFSSSNMEVIGGKFMISSLACVLAVWMGRSRRQATMFWQRTLIEFQEDGMLQGLTGLSFN